MSCQVVPSCVVGSRKALTAMMSPSSRLTQPLTRHVSQQARPRQRWEPSHAQPQINQKKKKKAKTTLPLRNHAPFEDEHHLAGSLPRKPLDPTLERKWSDQARRQRLGKDRWTHPPLESNRSNHGYELDALDTIHKRSYQANVLLEIRDGRLPSSTHHPSFTRLARHRSHLICYTHADVLDVPTRDRVRNWTQKSWPGSDCFFVDARPDKPDRSAAFDPVYDLIVDTVSSKGNNSALTVGVPNTGKSSVIQCLLRTAKNRDLIPQKGAKTRAVSKKKGKGVGAMRRSRPPAIKDVPGQTRELTEYMIRDKPRTLFLDVPGMTPPPFFFRDRPEAWHGYGAANLLTMGKDLRSDPDVSRAFCDYVLHCLNRDSVFRYVQTLHLDGPTDQVDVALSRVANKYADRFDEDALLLKRCETFLKLFNTGNFGSVVLDDIRRPYQTFQFRDEHFERRGGGDGKKEWEDDEEINYW